jgi:hypothetical protein
MATDAPLFTQRVWPHVQVLMLGALLAPGQRRVTAALRVMGWAHAKSFQTSHRVLHRTGWSRLEGARLVRRLWVSIRAPADPLLRGLDDPLERRWGPKIHAQGSDRHPVRSSPRPLVTASGWRWLRLLRLGPMAWAKRVGAWSRWSR